VLVADTASRTARWPIDPRGRAGYGKTVTHNNNFIYLTLSLTAMLIASSLLGSVPEGLLHLLLQVVIVMVLLVSYVSLSFGRYWRGFLATLVALAVLSGILRRSLDWEGASELDLLLLLSFFITAAWSASRQVLLSGRVTTNVIVGSVAIYLLLGLVWAMLYLLLLEFQPDAFHGIQGSDWGERFADVAYFSFVTLTTMGYGDISPAGSLARVLVYLEAIAGVFYMAIVVASLIGARARTAS
jgi:hypothetical protein